MCQGMRDAIGDEITPGGTPPSPLDPPIAETRMVERKKLGTRL